MDWIHLAENSNDLYEHETEKLGEGICSTWRRQVVEDSAPSRERERDSG